MTVIFMFCLGPRASSTREWPTGPWTWRLETLPTRSTRGSLTTMPGSCWMQTSRWTQTRWRAVPDVLVYAKFCVFASVNNIWYIFLSLSSLLTSQTQCTPLSTWEPTTAATLWQAQMRRKSCYHVVMKSPLWTPWHSRSARMKWYQTHPSSCLVKRKKWNKKNQHVRENCLKNVWTLYKMYKNEGLLLYVIAVLYFVLLRLFWSKMSNIFYERFLIYTCPLPFT